MKIKTRTKKDRQRKNKKKKEKTRKYKLCIKKFATEKYYQSSHGTQRSARLGHSRGGGDARGRSTTRRGDCWQEGAGERGG